MLDFLYPGGFHGNGGLPRGMLSDPLKTWDSPVIGRYMQNAHKKKTDQRILANDPLLESEEDLFLRNA